MDENIFLRGYLTGRAIQSQRRDAGTPSGESGGGTWDKESFLSGMAAGICAGGVFVNASGQHMTTRIALVGNKTVTGYWLVNGIPSRGFLITDLILEVDFPAGGLVTKCGICLKQELAWAGGILNIWDAVYIAFKGLGMGDIKVTMKALYRGDGTAAGSGIVTDTETFAPTISQDSNGVWSQDGSYGGAAVNIVYKSESGDSANPLIFQKAVILDGTGKVFSSVEDLKAYMTS